MMVEQFLAEFLESIGIGRFVDAIEGRPAELFEAGGNGLVGQEHVFLDELVGNVVFDHFNPKDAAGVVEADFAFGKIKIEGSGAESFPADFLGQVIGLVEHFFDFIGRFIFEDGEGLLVGEAPAGSNDSGIKVGFEDLASVADEKLGALGETIDVGFERAKLIAEGLGQHGDHAIDQVSGIAAVPGFFIQGGARFHVMGNVGDMDPDFPLAIRSGTNANRVVEILGVIRIDGCNKVTATIRASGKVSWGDFGADGSGFLKGALGKPERKVVMAQDAEHVDTFGIGGAEDFDNFAFGRVMAGDPLTQFDDDLVANVWVAAYVAGWRNVDIMGNTGVIRDDVEKVLTALEGADQLLTRAF